MEQPRATLRERNRRRVREEIGAAALALFLEHGYGATSVERVAAAAGVSLRTVFRHFPRKEDLFFHRHPDTVARMRALLAATPPERPSLDALVEALAALMRLDDLPADPARFLALLDAEPDLRRHESGLFAEHHHAVAEFLLARIGEEGPGAERRAEMLAGAFMGVMGAARRLLYAHPERHPPEAIQEAVALLRPLPWP